MHRLRSARQLARLILVWFALAVGVAAASPLVQPQATTLVCSIGGVMKIVPVGPDADAAPAGIGLLDCPLCLQIAAPPAPVQGVGTGAWMPGTHTRADGPVVVARSAAPLPGRGPPARS